MTQAGTVFDDFVGKARDASITFSREVIGKCPTHGDYTRGDIIQADTLGVECPVCVQDRQSEAKKSALIRHAARHFRESSGVPLRFQDASFDKFSPPTPAARANLDVTRGYVAGFSEHSAAGRSLILCGGPGTGKTLLACAVLRSLAHEQGIHGKYTTVYRAVQEVRESYRSREISELQALDAFIQPDLLVLDEIGVQYGTDSERIILFSILNGRYEAMKPTIAISNLPVDDAKKYLDERVYDRLRENGGGVLAFDWESWRQREVRGA